MFLADLKKTLKFGKFPNYRGGGSGKFGKFPNFLGFFFEGFPKLNIRQDPSDKHILDNTN